MIKYSRQREAIVQYLTGRTDHPAGSHICGIKSDNEERHLGQNGQIRYPSESASADHFPQERLDCDRQFQD